MLCYVNGHLLSSVSMNFYIDGNEVFDRCFIGCSSDHNNEMSLFSGQLSSIYLFSMALEAPAVEALFNLGKIKYREIKCLLNAVTIFV